MTNVKALLCSTYYHHRRRTANPKTPIDRWGQDADTRDLNELLDNLSALQHSHSIGVLVEPFAGLGSGALAARHLRLRYLGAEISPARARIAQAKGFLSISNSVRVPAEEFSDQMRSDLIAAPAPCSGELFEGDFRSWSPTLNDIEKAVFHVCPPFPRPITFPAHLKHARQNVADSREFDKLLADLQVWLATNTRPSDILLAEYFNWLPAYDTSTAMIQCISQVFSDVLVVATHKSSSAQSPYGDSGFILAASETLIAPTAWGLYEKLPID